MHAERNIETRSRNHFWRGKSVIILRILRVFL